VVNVRYSGLIRPLEQSGRKVAAWYECQAEQNNSPTEILGGGVESQYFSDSLSHSGRSMRSQQK